MRKRPLTQDIVDKVYRLQQIIEESSDIIRTTKNKKTEQSRIDLALTKVIELKGIAEVYPEIKTQNLELIEWQLTKAKYEHLKEQYETK